MFDVRWRKLFADAGAERGRMLALVAAIALSLSAIGAVLGAFAILKREIAVNYRGTRPASATLELPGGVDAALLDELRRRPELAQVEARDVLLARARVGSEWRPLLLFVVDDFERLRLNTFRPEAGAWPPPTGTLLVERAARSMLGAGLGDSLQVKTPHGSVTSLPISGIVHDPGLAPAWQERMGYAYLSLATLARLGEPAALHELRIEVRQRPFDRGAIVATASALAGELRARGLAVEEVRVPPPGMHPHQLQMLTILVLLMVFTALGLVLSGTLVATALSAQLARQLREIGIMKTLGARSSQIAALYAVLVGGIGVAASASAWPLGLLGAHTLASAVSVMLNFELTSNAVPGWVVALQVAAGCTLPLALSLPPILSASRSSVRDALDRHGVSTDTLRPAFSRLPLALRNALRRPARLALSLLLLGTGGAIFMSALNLRASWLANLDAFHAARSYDLEVRLREPQPLELAEQLRRLPGVRAVEAWGYAPTSPARSGEVDVSSAYPDGRHASFAMFAPPASTALIQLPILAGRWLESGDRDAVVLNHSALPQLPAVRVGAQVQLACGTRSALWRVVGIVEEVGSPPVAYVTDTAFARCAGSAGTARMLRVATTAGSERAAVLRSVEDQLERAGAAVEQGLPLAEHRTAVGDHILILLRALLALAACMGSVGAFGLAITLSVSVIERTREIGVMKAIGATPRRVLRDLWAEALGIGALSALLALLLSLPLTAYIDGLIGNLGFLSSLPFVIVPEAALGWLGIVLVVSLLATWLPARNASRLTIREALAHT
jgi:putative ABC transport system permease protein